MTSQFADMTPSSYFSDSTIFLLSSLNTGPSFTSISLLVLELWQFFFIEDWPEIRKYHRLSFTQYLENGAKKPFTIVAKVSILDLQEKPAYTTANYRVFGGFFEDRGVISKSMASSKKTLHYTGKRKNANLPIFVYPRYCDTLCLFHRKQRMTFPLHQNTV